MKLKDELGGGAFAEVRDGVQTPPTIRETSVPPTDDGDA